MRTQDLKFEPAEPVEQTSDGLIHGVSAAELVAIATACLDVRASAYCKLHLPIVPFVDLDETSKDHTILIS